VPQFESHRADLATDSANIADMEWALWIFLALMFGLYIWSRITAGHKIGKKIQPFVDNLFGVTPSKGETKPKPSANPKID
jgi:hypothetical protein